MSYLKFTFGYGKTFVETAISGVSESTVKMLFSLIIYLTALTVWFWLFLQWMIANQF
jgi:hypothetical protein